MSEVAYTLGELSLWLALLMCIWSALAATTARGVARAPLVASARRALSAAALLALLSFAGLVAALVRQDFSFAIVAATTSLSLPVPFRISALWSGQRGGTLLWAVSLTVAGALAVRSYTGRGSRTERPIIAVLASLATLLVGMAAVVARPYSRLEWPVAEGLGLPWELQHPGAAVEPVLLTAGMATLVVAMTLVVVDRVATRGGGPGPQAGRRSWFLAAWLLVSAGLFVEAWSTYAELGWGEYTRRTEIGALIALPWALAGAGWIASGRGSGSQPVRRLLLILLIVAAFSLLGGLVAWQLRRDEGYVMTAGQAEHFADSYGRTWEIASLGISTDSRPGAEVESIALEVSRDGGAPVLLRADLQTQMDARGNAIGGPVAVAAIHRGLRGDLFAAVDDILGERALVRVRFVPLSILVWGGGALFLLTLLVALVAARGRRQA